MKLFVLTIAVVVLSVAAAEAQQLQTRECNASNIAFVAEAIGKMPDTSKQKKTASDEIGAASEAMAQGKDEECKDHLLKATIQTK
jgi:hypothetical protein